jgi:hypothetical protein
MERGADPLSAVAVSPRRRRLGGGSKGRAPDLGTTAAPAAPGQLPHGSDETGELVHPDRPPPPVPGHSLSDRGADAGHGQAKARTATRSDAELASRKVLVDATLSAGASGSSVASRVG